MDTNKNEAIDPPGWQVPDSCSLVFIRGKKYSDWCAQSGSGLAWKKRRRPASPGGRESGWRYAQRGRRIPHREDTPRAQKLSGRD